MEFTEYWAIDNSTRGGRWISRRLPDDVEAYCVVDHPDAGGACGRPGVYEVVGLPFCETHAPEANAGILAQLYHDSMDEFARLDNEQAMPWQPEVLRVVREGYERTLETHIRYAHAKDRLVREAYPLIRERVDRETLDWEPGSLGDSPVDRWGEEYWEVCTLMLRAYGGLARGLVRELEPLRERAAAQLSYALVVCEEKIEAYKAARAKS